MQKMEPERLFSFTWHPYAVDPKSTIPSEPPTLVEFTLEPTATRHAAARRRVGLRQDPGRAPRRGLPHERGRLERADGEHRRAMSDKRPSRLAALKTRAPVFAALGDETRLSVLAKLCSGEPQSIARLTAGTDLTRQAVTKHLRVLARRRRGAQSPQRPREPLRAEAAAARGGARLSRPDRRSSGTTRWRA